MAQRRNAADPRDPTGGAGPGSGCGCPIPTANVARSRQSGATVCVAAQDANGCDLQSIAVPQPGPERPGRPDDRETLVSLRFRAVPDGTVVVLDQRAFATEARYELHRDGWTQTLERLAGFVA